MRKFFVFLTVILMASLLAACGLSVQERVQVSNIVDEAVEKLPTPQQPIVNVEVPEQPAPEVNIEVPEQPAPVINIEVPELPAPIVNVAVQEPTIQETDSVVEEPAVDESVAQEAVVLPDCPMENQGLRLDFTETLEKENGFYVLSSEIEQMQPYLGCNVLIEGRIELVEEHHIYVFSGDWELAIREGSLWVYPQQWNMDVFSTEKAPIATEFVVAKRNNQLENGYDWPIFVHTLSGDIVMFPAGATMPVVQLPNNADFSEPQRISVHGVWNSESEAFNASIGAERAATVALLDGELFFWADAQDNILFQSVEAWLMPSVWSFDQIRDWAEAQFPGQNLEPYIP